MEFALDAKMIYFYLIPVQFDLIKYKELIFSFVEIHLRLLLDCQHLKVVDWGCGVTYSVMHICVRRVSDGLIMII